MTPRIRPPSHSSNNPDNPTPEGPINVTANPHSSVFRQDAEGGLPERASAADLVKGPADPNAINANAASVTLPPLEAIKARQAMNNPTRLGKPAQHQLNDAERALLEYDESKAEMRAQYAANPCPQNETTDRHERAKETMIRLGLLKG